MVKCIESKLYKLRTIIHKFLVSYHDNMLTNSFNVLNEIEYHVYIDKYIYMCKDFEML